MDFAGITQQQVILQFMKDLLLDSQWVHHHIIPPMKLNKIESAKCGCILILIASVDP